MKLSYMTSWSAATSLLQVIITQADSDKAEKVI